MNASNSGRQKILIIDDELSIVKYLEALLQDHGYETVTALNGNEGMDRAIAERPDLICLDITMPEKSGIRFYKELRDNPDLAATPVIVVTAVTGYGGDSEAFRKFLSDRRQFPPPNDFIAKPIVRDEFLERVGKVLAASV